MTVATVLTLHPPMPSAPARERPLAQPTAEGRAIGAAVLYLPLSLRNGAPALAETAVPTVSPTASATARAAATTPPTVAPPTDTPEPTRADATPTATVTPQPTVTPMPTVAGMTLIRAFTGDGQGRRQSAFVAGDHLELGLEIMDQTITGLADMTFEVRGPAGTVVEALSFRGTQVLLAGQVVVSATVAIPPEQPVGRYSMTGTSPSARGVSKNAVFFIAAALERSDDFADTSSGWPTADPESTNADCGYQGGVYHILVHTKDILKRCSPELQLTDSLVEVDAWWVNGSGEWGLFMNYGETGYYVFSIDSSQRYRLRRRNPTQWRMLQDWTLDSLALRRGSAVNHLLVLRDGRTIGLYANGQELKTATDSGLVGGYFGLVAATLDQPMVDARFDNFRAYRLR